MINLHAIIFAALALAIAAVPVALCFIAAELRAIRKVLQARWDYDAFVSAYKLKDIQTDDEIMLTKVALSYLSECGGPLCMLLLQSERPLAQTDLNSKQ